MRIAISCFAFLVAAACYFIAAVSGGVAIFKHFKGELQALLEHGEEGLAVLVGGISFYAIIGTIALCLGLHLLAKPQPR